MAVLAAAAVAVLALLLAWRAPSTGQPQQPGSTVPAHADILTRVNYNKLLRIVGPYLPLYQKLMPPFNNLHPVRNSPNVTRPRPDDGPRVMSLGLVGTHLVPDWQWGAGVYGTVGKLTWTGQSGTLECTAVMVGEDVLVTADHCLPWSELPPVWGAIKFIPRYNAQASPVKPFGEVPVTRCVGVEPVAHDGTDMAACQLQTPVGLNSGYVHFGFPNPSTYGYDPVAWYTQRDWYSVGYKTPDAPYMTDSFTIGGVTSDDDDGWHVLESGFFGDAGWSGGPVFSSHMTGGSDFPVQLGAVVSECVGPAQNCVGAGKSILVGGVRLSALVTYGLLNFTDAWGFTKSP
jgi:hypothetical protein